MYTTGINPEKKLVVEVRKKTKAGAKSLRNMGEILPSKQEEDMPDVMQGYLLC